MTRLIYPIIFSLLFIVRLNAQDRLGPCLRVYVEPGCPAQPENAVSLNFLSVGLSHPDITSGLSNQDSARYKAFWIFGDGNFANFDDGEKGDDIATLSTVYTYASNSEYNPRSVLVEKKSDREPPARTKRKVRISQEGTKVAKPATLASFEQSFIQQALTQLITANNFKPRVANNYRVDNLNSSKIRLGGYETAFAISSLIPQSSDSTVILLCYNSVMDTLPSGYRICNLFTESEIEIANYTNRGGRSTSIGALPAALSNALQPYGNVIAQPVEIGANKPVNFSEFRFFPVLNTALKASGNAKTFPPTGLPVLDRTGKGIAQFLVLVLENARYLSTNNSPGQIGPIVEPISENAQGSSMTTAQRDTILSLVKKHLDSLEFANDNTLRLSNGMYLRGVHYLTVPVVTVIDPTELKVLTICKEEGKDDSYKAEMKLTVCNEGNAMESLVKVDLLRVDGIPYQELTFNMPAPVGFKDSIPNDFAFTISNLRGAYNEQLEYQESCVDVSFSFKTNWQGVELLRDGKGLTARVNFTSAGVNPVQNFPNKSLDVSKVSKENGYQCGPPTPQFDCMLLCILLFVLLLLIWWYWKNRQDA